MSEEVGNAMRSKRMGRRAIIAKNATNAFLTSVEGLKVSLPANHR